MIRPENGRKIYIRAKECSPTILADGALITSFLIDVTKLIGMEAMEKPFTYRVGPSGEYHSEVDYGVTSHCAWKKSGSMLHSWPELSLLHFDCESCEDFDVGNLVEFTKAVFRSLDMRVYDLSYVLRGENASEEMTRLKKAAISAYESLQRLSPGCDEAVRLGAELFL